MADLLNDTIKLLASKWSNASRTSRLVLVAVIFVLLFVGARLEFFGERPSKLTHRLIDYLPLLDAPPTAMIGQMAFFVNRGGSLEAGKLGEVYFPGDHLNLELTINQPGWVTVFAVDTVGVHAVFPDPANLGPGYLEPQEQGFRVGFELDDTRGEEVYFMVMRKSEFAFDDILSTVESIDRSDLTRGPGFKWTLELPEGFTQSSVHFVNSGVP